MNLIPYLALNLKFVLNKKSVCVINTSQLLYILEIWDRARDMQEACFAKVRSCLILASSGVIQKQQ